MYLLKKTLVPLIGQSTPFYPALPRDPVLCYPGVKHIQRYTVKANGGPSSPLYAGTKGDEAQLMHSPLAWLLVVASSPSFDAFPRQHLALFLSLYLGLPIPRSTGVAQLAVHCLRLWTPH